MGEVIKFQTKQGLDQATEEISRTAASITYIDDSFNPDSKLPPLQEDDEVVTNLDASEEDLLKQILSVRDRLDKDYTKYKSSVKRNLRDLMEDPENMSVALVKQAILENVDQELSQRICRHNELLTVLQSFLFWRLKYRTGIYNHELSIR